MVPELRVDLPWLPGELDLQAIVVSRGYENVLTYDDGIRLAVEVRDPALVHSLDELIESVLAGDEPGSVVLVAGQVPASWRSKLRERGISWADAGGAISLDWPRVRVTSHQASIVAPRRRRQVVPLQRGVARVAQEIAIRAVAGTTPMILADLVDATGVSLSSVSRLVSALAAHGWVKKSGDRRPVEIEVPDLSQYMEMLAERTRWNHLPELHCYGWGPSLLSLASEISARSDAEREDIAITGRIGAAFHGVLSSGQPRSLHVRAGVEPSMLFELASHLRLEVVNADEANVVLAADRWRVGSQGAERRTFDGMTATVAHPVRVWCDLRDEQRGNDIASELWKAVRHGA